MNPSDLCVVVLNNHCQAQGGASRVAIDEAVDLANSGARVVFVGAVGPVCAELLQAPLRVVCLGQRELADAAGGPAVIFQGLWNAAAYRVLRELLGELDPRKTIVHLHGFTQALSASPVRCCADMGFTMVYTMHDFFTACPTGLFFDFASSTPCTRQAMSFDCITTNCDKRRYAHKLYRVTRSAIQLWFGDLPKSIKNYISLSRRSEEVLKAYLPTDAHFYSLPNPIGIDRDTPVDASKNTRMVAVGRLDPEKGINILLQAARVSGTELTLVGDGPLREQAEASGLCRVTGWLSRAQVLTELESARCLVFPSLWYETYGLAVSEAAARGIPAIVSDTSAAAERVENNITGWHMRAGDAVDLARCLSIAKQDETVRSAGSEAYTRWWSNPLTRKSHVMHLSEIYMDILARNQ